MKDDHQMTPPKPDRVCPECKGSKSRPLVATDFSEADRAKFWKKTKAQGECILWTGFCHRNGYGIFTHNGFNHRTHRISYALHVGKARPGFFICHRCDTPACVNPAHLFEGTPADNVHDMITKGRKMEQKRTCCARGHPYPEGSVKINKSRGRYCSACNTIWARTKKANHRAKLLLQ